MKSLRLKIILVTLALQFVMLALLLVTNRSLVEPYFVWKTRQDMRDAYALYMENGENLRIIGADTGFKLSVTDSEGTVVDSSSPEYKPGTLLLLPKEQLEFLIAHKDSLREGYPVTNVIDREPDGQSVIQLAAALRDGRFLVITQQLKQVRQSVRMVEGFFLAAGTLLLIISIIGSSMISWRFVKPIREMTDIAGHIARLDFSRTYGGTSRDEIGRLGESMNAIGEKMNRALSDLKSANEELSGRMTVQRRFLASVSHEFKTPLGLISGYAEILDGGIAENPEERQRGVRIILAETDRLTRLIDDIIELARLGNTSFSLRKEPFPLNDVITALPGRFGIALGRRNLKLSVDADDSLTVDGDAQRLTEVFDNLVSNAIRHADKGSTILVSAHREANGIRATVYNKGVRIPDEDLARIFEPFWRAEEDRSRNTGGSGLGLSIAREIMSLHGGSCSVENSGDGVVCSLVFPV